MWNGPRAGNTYIPHFFRRGAASSSPFWRVGLPLAVIVLLVAGAGVTLAISHSLEHQQREEKLISDSLWAEQALAFEGHRMIESIQVLARDIDMSGTDDPYLFERRAAELLQRSAAVRRLCRVDRAGVPYRCYPDHTGATGADAAPAMHEALDRALRLRRPAAVSWPDAPDTGMVVLAVPIAADRRDVALVAQVSLPQLVSDTVPWWFAHDNEVTLSDLHGRVLAVRDPSVKGRGVYTHGMETELAGMTLFLAANSTQGRPSLVPSSLAAAVLGLSALLAWCVWALWRDLVRRTLAERALREQQALRQAMENSLMSGLRARDLAGRITYVNPAFCEMVGYQAGELIGCVPPMPYWAPEHSERSKQRHEQLLARTLPSAPFESAFVRRDGVRRDVLVSEAPLLDGNGVQTGWMASIMDITEQKRAQEFQRKQDARMNRMSRLMTMGEITSALAHELNQPLVAINSYCAAAANLLANAERDRAAAFDVEGEVAALVVKARTQSERAGQIIQRVHHFVRKAEPELGPVSLAEVITGLRPLILLQTGRAGEAVDIDIARGLAPVQADRVLLEQVLLNLTRNAFEAMGHLPPAARRVRISVEAVRSRAGAACARVTVRDWGHGLIAGARQALESPFFTTKSEGMGMGLAVCRSALELMRARLAYDTCDVGARFYFDLPILDSQT